MHSFIRSALAAVVVSAIALSGCGGSSPSSPSGKGVVLQGTVLSTTAAAGASAHAGASAASGKMVVTVQENPRITATVSANGTFELEGLPSGTITLVFTIDGKVVGTLTLTGLGEDVEVKIVVQITPDGVILIEIKIEGQDDDGDPTTPPSARPAPVSSREAAPAPTSSSRARWPRAPRASSRWTSRATGRALSWT